MATQILLFHENFERSRANRALVDAVRQRHDVTITDMGSLYASGDAIDLDREVARLLAADRLVLQFPVQWYSTPPLLKAWQDSVLTRMYYINAATEGDRLKGMPMLVAATAGNLESAYAPDGQNLFPLGELLRPLQSTAHRCGWRWADPFLAYRSNKLDDAELAALGARYATCIADWIADTDEMRNAA